MSATAILKPKILCVDDDPDLLNVTSEILRTEGYEVIEAATGRECLNLAKKERPDMILLDVILPDINGMEVCRLIKSDEALIGTYVMLISGIETSSVRQVDGLEVGADGYIVRPIPWQEFLSRVQAMMRISIAEKHLRESERKYKELVLNIPGMVYSGGPNWSAEIISGSEELCGYSAEDFNSGKVNWLDIIHPEDRERILRESAEITCKRKNIEQQYRIITKNGSIRHVLDRKTSSFSDVRFSGVNGIVLDISEHKKTEEDLQNALIAAKSASWAKSEFLANMSHEFITPLNAVIGFSQVLKDGLSGELNDKQKEYVDYILQGGLQLFGILNQIIELARVESDKEEIKSGRFLLKDALKSSVAAFNDKAIKHSLKLSLEIEPDADIEIETDSGKLTRILNNLIDNAVKFTPDGGSVSVQARLTRDEGGGTREEKASLVLASEASDRPSSIEISVADTGIGIKPEDIDRLFQPFAQLESPYTKSHGGTGVGLILTKRLIELLGGRIQVESEYGKGSKFTFVIPIKQNSRLRRVAEETESSSQKSGGAA